MKGIQVLDRPASQSFYAVAGRLLFVETLDRDLAEQIERVFSGWQLTPLSSSERTPEIRIVFSRCETLPAAPGGLTQFEVASGGRCYVAEDEYYLTFEQSMLHLKAGSPVFVSVL